MSGDLHPVNPFAENGDAESIDIGDAHACFTRFASWLAASPVNGGFVLVGRGSGTGKSTLIRRCVGHWASSVPVPRGNALFVDLSGYQNSMPGAVSARRAAVCTDTVNRLRTFLTEDVTTALEKHTDNPDAFYRLLSAELGRRDAALALRLPPVDDRIMEAAAYAGTAFQRIVFFAETAFLDDAQLDASDRAGALVLRLRELAEGELRLFVADRTAGAVGVFPKPTDGAIDYLGGMVKTVRQARELLHHTYENRLRDGQRYGADDLVDESDVRSAQSTRQREPGGDREPEPSPAVAWCDDVPARTDVLRRNALAEVIARRLRDNQRDRPDTSLLIHIDGAWGTGKTTLMSLLDQRLTTDPAAPEDESTASTAGGELVAVVRFDAWQQSRLALPWWSLLTALRSTVLGQRRLTRPLLHLWDVWTRARRAGGRYLLPVLLVPAVAAALWLGMSALLDGGAKADIAKSIGGALSVLVLLWSGAKVANRALLWRSATGARLFEQTDSNPMGRIVQQFAWYLDRSKRPVVFLIDDLDRCRDEYVVELLDTVQTFVRGYPDHSGARSRRAACFVLAADGAWIRAAYVSAYPSLDGRPATGGHGFTDKLFQLTVPMPGLSLVSRETLLRHLLVDGPEEQRTDEIAAARSRVRAAAGDEGRILGVLADISDPQVLTAVTPAAAVAVSSPAATARAEHRLAKFVPLLSENPREMKLFLNTYGMLRTIRTLEGNVVEPDVLARWSILRVRWPAVADHLQRSPEAVRAIREPRWWADDFPEELRPVIRNAALHAVVTHRDGGMLTALAIRRCCGTL